MTMEIETRFSFERAMDKYLRKENENKNKQWWSREEKEYHVSDGSKCLRKGYYKDKTGPKDVDESALRYFKRGNIIEEVAEEVIRMEFETENYIIDNSHRFTEDMGDYVIRGETDIIKRSPVSGDILTIFEIKSTGNLDFKRDAPDKHHLEQLNAYLGFTDTEEGYVIYISPDDFKSVTHKVSFDEEMFEGFKSRIRELDGAIDRDTPPSTALCEPKWECDYCDYYSECKG